MDFDLDPALLQPDSLKILWKVEAPRGFSSVVADAQRAYTLVAREESGLLQEVLVCLSVENGEELWSRALGPMNYGHAGGEMDANGRRGGDGPRSTPALREDRVYTVSSDLLLFCLDAVTGELVWRRNLLLDFKGKPIKWEYAASPVLDGDRLFLGGGGVGQALFALDRHTGETLWKGQNDVMTHSTPVVVELQDVRQVVYFTQRGLVSLEVATGEVLWRHGFPFALYAAISPVVAGNRFYVANANNAIGSAGVQVLKRGGQWEVEEFLRVRTRTEMTSDWNTPIFYRGCLFGIFGGRNLGQAPLMCAELQTGDILWSRPGFGHGNLIRAGRHLLVLTDQGQLVVVLADRREYQELARVQVLEGKCWSTPAISHGKLFLRSTLECVCIQL